MLTLNEEAKATLNLADATLALNAGIVTVNGDESGNMYSMLALSDGSYLRLNLTIDTGATANVPVDKTLKIVSGSSMAIDGTLDIGGTLTIAEGVTLFKVTVAVP